MTRGGVTCDAKYARAHIEYGLTVIIDIDGNKLEVEFDQAGSKRVLDGFVRAA